MEKRVEDNYHRTIGWLEDRGTEIVAMDFYHRILGFYDKKLNKTLDFYHRPICSGDGTMGLIMMNANK